MSARRGHLLRRGGQFVRVWNAQGSKGVTDLVRSGLARVVAPAQLSLPVRESDVISADLDRPPNRFALGYRHGDPMIVNWVMTPPTAGSGGHTTIFRIVNFLESRGHLNRVYFYDIYLTDPSRHRSVVRDYFGFKGPVGDVDDGMDGAHAVLATGWPTAYPVYNSPSPGVRCYFIQDFEPSFHATSASSVLAENTYRMNFHGITAGAWLAEKVRAEYGMHADHFRFGCDAVAYTRSAEARRNGIAFYVRPEAPRRASELGMMALEIFAKRRPDIEIHLYGDKIGPRPFAFVDHGRVTPLELNTIYNRCYAGLSLSLTNVSLVPHEMLASGCIPIVNDAEHNRIVLDNPYVRYAALTPHSLARELEAVVALDGFDSLSKDASRSVRSHSWDDAGATVEAAFRRLLSTAVSSLAVPTRNLAHRCAPSR